MQINVSLRTGSRLGLGRDSQVQSRASGTSRERFDSLRSLSHDALIPTRKLAEFFSDLAGSLFAGQINVYSTNTKKGIYILLSNQQISTQNSLILANKFCPFAVVPALHSIWFYRHYYYSQTYSFITFTCLQVSNWFFVQTLKSPRVTELPLTILFSFRSKTKTA